MVNVGFDELLEMVTHNENHCYLLSADGSSMVLKDYQLKMIPLYDPNNAMVRSPYFVSSKYYR